MRTTWLWIMGVTCVCSAVWCGALAAQPVPPPEAAEEPASSDGRCADAVDDATPSSPLSNHQRQVRQRFIELERLLLPMAELTAPTDPGRATLLRRAVAQSKQRDIDHQFEELVKLLERQQLATAVRGQGDVQRNLARLLELLLSEDRGKRIESEKERIRAYLKRVNKIIKEQKAVQRADQSRRRRQGIGRATRRSLGRDGRTCRRCPTRGRRIERTGARAAGRRGTQRGR